MFFGFLEPRHFHLASVSLIVSILAVFILAFNLSLETTRVIVLSGVLSSVADAMPRLEQRTVVGVKVRKRAQNM